ncbi:MAG: DUF4406 domain-containing protein [Lachnospiraceae bacterium]|nr:DUF4406 domain-containing protein [Lachnospiraceae bacterium]
MARIYISGPITGNEDYQTRFAQVEAKLKVEGHEVINPAALDTCLPFLGYEEFMRLDFCLLDMCNVIYMLKGWKKSPGANREYGYALGKGYIIWEEELDE